MWRIVASALVGLAGCDRAFDFTLPAGDAAIAIDADPNACAALSYDPARYAPVTSAGGHAWTEARLECAKHGGDLAVLDRGDGDELVNQSTGAPVPFWLGVSYGDSWAAIDGCTPSLTWAAGEPAHAEPGYCVLVTAQGMATERCTAMTHLGEPIHMLCETPRLDPGCLALDANSEYELLAGMLVSQPVAEMACAAKGAHLVELNSSAELERILQDIAPGTTVFWLGATYDGGAWIAPTTCPQVFPWKQDEPDLGDAYLRCALHEGGVKTEFCNSRMAAVICETNAP